MSDIKERPFFSVIICNYNYGHFIQECIVSVLDQTDGDFELIVVDDGSTDESRSVIEQFTDQRIIPVFKENAGQASAFNEGIKHSSGQVICFLDSDDWWELNKLETIRQWDKTLKGKYGLIQHQMTVTDTVTFEPYSNGLFTGDAFQDMQQTRRMDYFVPTSGLAVRKDIFEKIAPIPLQFITCADAFITRTTICFGPLVSIPNALGYYRRHDNLVLGNNNFNYYDYFGKLLFPALNLYYEKLGEEFRFSLSASPNDPLEFLLLKELLKARWSLLQGKPIAIYGAGQNAQWIETIVQDRPGPTVDIVMDDRGANAPPCWGLTPTEFEQVHDIQLPILITSDAHFDVMKEKCIATFGSSVEFINLFENLPLEKIISIPKLAETSNKRLS